MHLGNSFMVRLPVPGPISRTTSLGFREAYLDEKLTKCNITDLLDNRIDDERILQDMLTEVVAWHTVRAA